MMGSTPPRDNYVTAPNAVDENGKAYYKPLNSQDPEKLQDEVLREKAVYGPEPRDYSDSSIDIYGADKGSDGGGSRSLSDMSTPPAGPDGVTAGMENLGSDSNDATAQALEDMSTQGQANREQDAQRETLLAGARFFLDVQNANSAYAAYKGAAIMNIANVRLQGRDSLARGKSRALAAAQEGETMGDEALLAMAAQGQDVNAQATTSVEESYEIVGVYNALIEETNSIREALGYEMQEVAMDYELDQKRNERNSTIISSALNYGATATAYNFL